MPSPAVTPLEFCPRCFRAGAQDLSTCIDKQGPMNCPKPLPVVAGKMAVLECLPCEKTIAVPVALIMANDLPRGSINCRGDCAPSACKAFLRRKV